MEKPLVSVKTITYNHEKYIAKCIEGIMMQKTNFSFEYIIGEDCSTDDTMKIVQEYAKKYPDIIRVITSEKNVGFCENDHRTDMACRGKYAAFCEGDDFWTDPYKLQKQVDFLEANPDYAFIHTNFSCLNGKKVQKDVWDEKEIPEGNILDELILKNKIVTGSVCMRNEFLQNIRIADQIKENEWQMGDYPLWIEAASRAKVAYLPESTMIYRVHSTSATHSLDWKGMYRFFQDRFRIKRWYATKFNREHLMPKIDEMYYRELLKYAIFLKDEKLREDCIRYFENRGKRNEMPYLIFSKYSFLDSFFKFIYKVRKQNQTMV